MANAENLLPPWEPGQSGNPAGKQPGTKNRSTIIKKLLEARLKGIKDPYGVLGDGASVSGEEALEIKAFERAMGLGKTKPETAHKAYQEIKDTVYGKNTQVIGSDPEKPIYAPPSEADKALLQRFLDAEEAKQQHDDNQETE